MARDYCLLPSHCLLPTHFTSKVQVSWKTFLIETAICICPYLRSFTFALYPRNKPSVMGRWSCALCCTLNTLRLKPASLSRVPRILVLLSGS